MFLQTRSSNKPLSTAAKARLNTHSHKLETNIESRKRSPDGYPGPPSPSSSNDVMVFTNTQHGGRSHNARSLPSTEYPNVDEMQRYLQDVWDQKMKELNDPNSKLKYLHLGKPNEKNYRKESTPPVSQPPTPVKQRNSPQHNVKRF